MVSRFTTSVRYGAILVVAAMAALPFAVLEAEDAGVERLRSQILDRGRAMQDIAAEILRYEAKLKEVGAARNTLEHTIEGLDISRKKLQSEIQLTLHTIAEADYRIDELQATISETRGRIDRGKGAVGATLQQMHEMEDRSFAEIILSGESFGSMWATVDELQAFQEKVGETLFVLAAAKQELEEAEREASRRRQELALLQGELEGEKGALDATRQEKNKLLSVTKNEEANYQALLEEKRAARQRMENEMRALEEALRIAIDPNKFPEAGSKVLGHPIPGAVLTQGYGLTSFALGGAYGYDAAGNPKPHRGIDYGVPVGTAIQAPLAGVVRGVENMDAYPGCYSFGKWILLEHANGLSSLYAHLSSFAVSEGQKVATGQVIGYSGNSGYSTNPHLHFSLYATQGVQVQRFSTSMGCKAARVPLAAPEAYLNPLDYL